MERKIILLDVDGTIYNAKGEIPESTRIAISKAREKQHVVLLCTGRSYSEIGKELWQLGLDGMIGSAGAFICYKDEILYHKPMTTEATHYMLDFFEKYHIPYVLETNEAIFGKPEGIAFVDRIFQERLAVNPNLAPDFLGESRIVEDCYGVEKVNKFLFFEAPYSIEKLKEWFGKEYTLVPNSVVQYGTCSGEISEKGMTKAKGIEKFLELTGADIRDTIAFGDGANDMEMIQYAHIGVAMGNAGEELKSLADYVTQDVAENGIYKAFAQFQLL